MEGLNDSGARTPGFAGLSRGGDRLLCLCRTRGYLLGRIKLPPRVHRRVGSCLFDRERRVIMDFNPKAGCTIAVKMFFKHMGLLEEAMEYSNWVHDYRIERFIEEHPCRIEDLLSRRNRFFKVVRNPFARVVSSLYQKVNNRRGIDRINEALGLAQIEDITFRKFVSYLEKIDLRIQVDSHYRQQAAPYEVMQLRRPVVCRVEDLENDLRLVNRRFGTAFDLSGIGSEHHARRDGRLGEFAADIPWKDFDGVYPEYRYFYDRELHDRVEALYRSDLETYGYKFPWPEAIA